MAGVMAWIIKTTLVFQGTVSILGIGVLLLMTSVLGLCGARKKAEFGPSCWILTYFFFDLTLIVLAMFVTIWQFQFSSWSTLVSEVMVWRVQLWLFFLSPLFFLFSYTHTDNPHPQYTHTFLPPSCLPRSLPITRA